MRFYISIFFIMLLSKYAFCYLPSDTEGSFADIIRALFLLAFLTPFGWAGMIIVVVLIVQGLCKAGKHVATTDYSQMPEEDKENIKATELREVFKSFKNR